MKRIFYLFFIAMIVNASPVYAEEFISGFEDIPMMKGFTQQENQTFSFGNEETGYSEAIIITQKNISFSSVQEFYQGTLPKLGWKLLESDNSSCRFGRENDILEISRLSTGPLKLSISLRSKN